MAMKKRSLPQDQKKSNDDIVIYKIMTVLAALCMLLLSLQMLSRVYRLSENRFIVRPYIGGAAVVFAVLAVVLFLCYRARRTSSRFWKLAGVQLGVASLVAALSCWLLYATWISYLAALYLPMWRRPFSI